MTTCRASGNRVSANTCLLGQVFFVSSTAFRLDQVRNTIGLLGGRVEVFFSRDVTSLIIDDCYITEYQAVEGWRHNALASHKPRNAGSVCKFNRSRSFQEPQTAVVPCTSRGYSLLLTSVGRPDAFAADSAFRLIQRARQWGISVIGIRQFMAFLEKKMSPTLASPKRSKPCSQAIKLSGCFIKVEDFAHVYRTFYKIFNEDPVKYLPLEFRNFLSTGVFFNKQLLSSSVQKNCAKRNKFLNLEANSKVRKATDSFKVTPKSKKKQNLFCECCNSYFSDIHHHVVGEKHQSYANNEINYECVRDIMKTLPTVEHFLQNHNSSCDFVFTESAPPYSVAHFEPELYVQDGVGNMLDKMLTRDAAKFETGELSKTCLPLTVTQGMVNCATFDSDRPQDFSMKLENVTRDGEVQVYDMSPAASVPAPPDNNEPINFDFEDDWLDAFYTEIKRENVEESYKEFAEHCQKLLSESLSFWENHTNGDGVKQHASISGKQLAIDYTVSEPSMKTAASIAAARNSVECNDDDDDAPAEICNSGNSSLVWHNQGLANGGVAGEARVADADKSHTVKCDFAMADNGTVCKGNTTEGSSPESMHRHVDEKRDVAKEAQCVSVGSRHEAEMGTDYSLRDMELESTQNSGIGIARGEEVGGEYENTAKTETPGANHHSYHSEHSIEDGGFHHNSKTKPATLYLLPSTVARCTNSEVNNKNELFVNELGDEIKPNDCSGIKFGARVCKEDPHSIRVGAGITIANPKLDATISTEDEIKHHGGEITPVVESGSGFEPSSIAKGTVQSTTVRFNGDQSLTVLYEGDLKPHAVDKVSVQPLVSHEVKAPDNKVPPSFLQNSMYKNAQCCVNEPTNLKDEKMFSSDEDSDGGIRCDAVIGNVLTMINDSESPVKTTCEFRNSAAPRSGPGLRDVKGAVPEPSSQVSLGQKKKRRRKTAEWSVCIVPSKSIRLRFTRGRRVQPANAVSECSDGRNADQSGNDSDESS